MLWAHKHGATPNKYWTRGTEPWSPTKTTFGKTRGSRRTGTKNVGQRCYRGIKQSKVFACGASYKNDGSTRFCVGYRKLNDVTKKDSHLLPRINDTLTRLSGSAWFSTLVLRSSYWQADIHPEDEEKTAFSAGSYLYQFTLMPFGLCNAPATWETNGDGITKANIKNMFA